MLQTNETAVQRSRQVPESRVREAINPRTGRCERVFVNLEAIYPDYENSTVEMSFEELRAINRGWMQKDWRTRKVPLKQVSGNVPSMQPTSLVESKEAKSSPKGVPVLVAEPYNENEESYEGKAAKPRKMKVREVKGETQTSESCSVPINSKYAY